MLEISGKTNLLEQNAYKYSLQDVAEPNLQRDIYTQGMVPKVPFNHRRVPMNMPEEIWITDTSLRDGQQSVEPYTVDQIVNIYKYLSRLGGPYGIIRQTEFFIYSKKDREALEKCMELGLKFPEITTWIRATKEDFRLVRDLGIRETGILVSCSDYHIFKKMKMTRRQAMDYYLATVADAFEAGVVPRCHLEDITRADFYGFVVPFVNELQKLSRQAGIPVKIRACDTMGDAYPYHGGFVVPFVNAAARRASWSSAAWPVSSTACSSTPTCRASASSGTGTTILQGGRQRLDCVALRCVRGQLLPARHRRAHGQHPARGDGVRVRVAARLARRHGPDRHHRDRGLLPARDRL